MKIQVNIEQHLLEELARLRPDTDAEALVEEAVGLLIQSAARKHLQRVLPAAFLRDLVALLEHAAAQ